MVMERIVRHPDEAVILQDRELASATFVLMNGEDAGRAGFPGLVRGDDPFPVAVGVNKAGFSVEARILLGIKPIFEGTGRARVLKNEEELKKAAFVALGIPELYKAKQS
jgi:hypothetical protein